MNISRPLAYTAYQVLIKQMVRVSVICNRQFSSSFYRPLTHFTEEELMIRKSVKHLAQETIRPMVRKMESQKKLDPNIIKNLFGMGIMGMEIPTQYGGTETNFTSTIIAVEEIAKVDASVAILVDIQNTLVNAIIKKVGSEKQKSKYLPKLAKDSVGSFCLSEESSGSDAFALKTLATKEGDHYIINGTKMWISNSDIAKIFIVFVNAEPSAGHRGK